MQWWNDLVDWITSDEGWRVLTTAVFPLLAIVIAGLIAAWIGRASARRLLAFQDRELKASAIATLIGVGRKAATWSSLSTVEQQHYDTLISEADARIRLLPVSGSTIAADWAAHQIAEMKKNSAIFSFQAEQTLEEFRDRLIEWQHKPARARKVLKYDLEQWKFQAPTPEQDLSVKQQEWAKAHEPGPLHTSGAGAGAGAAHPERPADARTADARTADAADAVSAPSTGRTTVIAASPVEAASPASPAASTPESEPVVESPVSGPIATPPAGAGHGDGYAPPVTASTVRQRTNPPTDD
ncbi:hypothetical protein [Ruicaihuangia caeni]|uniref:DUF4760 domain-containing protein n=1 Tax=Ruicaihuangia caeni TaxID=3042517 RepID=A0AAW6T2W0_9MICO|nr:hypothetical protein [Klugiella sp. YN-L-19]MDI2097769.1 hypothetical protein [Klugiella sp. YN-L-19]